MSLKEELFCLKNRSVVITGAAGLLGKQHAEAVAAFGGVPILLDIQTPPLERLAKEIFEKHRIQPLVFTVDITNDDAVKHVASKTLAKVGKVDALINNAAHNPAVSSTSPSQSGFTRLENLSLDSWNRDIAVGLTGAVLCAKHFGPLLAANPEGGTILNISSDLALISPDQRLYRRPGLPDSEQPVKPVSYSVVKSGLLGLTRYLATYWVQQGVRCNAICPGGVRTTQSPEFVEQLSKLIPLGRMARPDEYQGLIVFLLSKAASYLNGATISADGGRVIW